MNKTKNKEETKGDINSDFLKEVDKFVTNHQKEINNNGKNLLIISSDKDENYASILGSNRELVMDIANLMLKDKDFRELIYNSVKFMNYLKKSI